MTGPRLDDINRLEDARVPARESSLRYERSVWVQPGAQSVGAQRCRDCTRFQFQLASFFVALPMRVKKRAVKAHGAAFAYATVEPACRQPRDSIRRNFSRNSKRVGGARTQDQAPPCHPALGREPVGLSASSARVGPGEES